MLPIRHVCLVPSSDEYRALEAAFRSLNWPRRYPWLGRALAPRPAADQEQTKAIREWARQNGFELADRGRIAVDVTEAFEKARTTAGKTKEGPEQGQGAIVLGVTEP